MLQALGGRQEDSDCAWGNLTTGFLHLNNIAVNTQYWESNPPGKRPQLARSPHSRCGSTLTSNRWGCSAPCNESPLGWAFAVSQTFVRSWQDGVVEIFPAAPRHAPTFRIAALPVPSTSSCDVDSDAADLLSLICVLDHTVRCRTLSSRVCAPRERSWCRPGRRDRYRHRHNLLPSSRPTNY